jgi:predicted nucleic acid-binding protein
VRVYLDTSVLIALLTQDALTTRAETFMRTYSPILVLSDFASAEFASAMARRVRTGEMT